MFGIDFYPTPKELISRLTEGIDWTTINTVLEPSAGKGDIAASVKSRRRDYYGRSIDIDCVEIDPNLQSVLKGAELRVVHDDFLTFKTYTRYDLIIGNPPFSDGDRHLLKAIELQKNGGKIRFLVNAETIRNPYTNTRKELAAKLKECGGTVEMIEGAFSNAERKTGVEVALIKIDIPRSLDGESVILEGMRKAQAMVDAAAPAQGQVVHADLITGLVDQYNYEAQANIAFINEHIKLQPYMLKSLDEKDKSPILLLKIGEHHAQKAADVNSYIKMLRAKYWSHLLGNRKFTGVLTSKLESLYLSKIKELEDFEFSLFNIYSMALEFHKLAIVGVEEAIIKLFDKLSYTNSYHENYDTDNIHYYNGWETNKSWRINNKVIRPMYCLNYNNEIAVSYDSLRELVDIEKVFSYLDGKPLNDSGTFEVIDAAVKKGVTRNIETTYFEVTFYKKGTCHIKFTNADLLAKFNIYGSQQKKWLPPTYGKAAYSDMSTEEQSVVDSFEGAAAYAKTFARREFFLTSSEKLLTGAA